jgi:hypothetical protein
MHGTCHGTKYLLGKVLRIGTLKPLAARQAIDKWLVDRHKLVPGG